MGSEGDACGEPINVSKINKIDKIKVVTCFSSSSELLSLSVEFVESAH